MQPDKNREIVWSEREDQRLFNSYGKVTKDILSLLFPDRSHQAILTRASILRHPLLQLKYTKEEDSFLLESRVNGAQYIEIAKHFTNRTPQALRQRVRRLRKNDE